MSTLTAHGACLLWKPELIWLNAVSDALLAIAFFVTAFVLGFFVWRRRSDVLFRGVFWIFAVFAAFCGMSRLLSSSPMGACLRYRGPRQRLTGADIARRSRRRCC